MPDATAHQRLQDPRERPKPRRRIDLAAIVIGLMIALTPEPSNAVLVGVIAGIVLLTIKWMIRRWRGSRDEASPR